MQEEKKKELAMKREEKKRERERKKKKQQKKRTQVESDSENSQCSGFDEDAGNPGTSADSLPSAKKSCKRNISVPSRYRDSSDFESSDGDESDTVCSRCNKRDPEQSTDEHIFWIDCDSCGKWYHTVCVYGKNRVTRRLLCEDCLP